jgi:hypothetical protein
MIMPWYQTTPPNVTNSTPVDDVNKPCCCQCEKKVNYLFQDGRCSDCTRLTIEKVFANMPRRLINI